MRYLVNNINIHEVSEKYISLYELVEKNEIHFTVFIIGYNCEKWITTQVNSVADQYYSNFEIIYINPQSTDKTQLYVERILKNKKIPFNILINNPRKYQTENFFTVTEQAKSYSIMVSVDGDDWLKHNKVLEELNMIYYATNCLMTYGLYEEIPLKYVDMCWKEIPTEILLNGTIQNLI